MKIARFSIKNFLGIKEANISPGEITIFAGKNGMGKTSILKAIKAAFKGTSISEIHQGTERAELVVELDDIKVTRVQTKKTSEVTVKTKEGFTRPAPQKFLDGLLGDYAFNPLEFLLAEKKEKRDLILRAMAKTVTREEILEAAGGITVPVADSAPALEQYEEARRFFYTARTDVNRILKQKQGAAAEADKKFGSDFVPVADLEEQEAATIECVRDTEASIAGLEEQKRASARAAKTRERIFSDQAALQASYQELGSMIGKITFTTQDLSTAGAKIDQLEHALKVAKSNRDQIAEGIRRRDAMVDEQVRNSEQFKKNEEALEALPGEFDVEMLNHECAVLAGHNGHLTDIARKKEQMRGYAELSILKNEVQILEQESGKLSALVERFGKELPAKALVETNLPIKGLSIEGEQILVDGIPIEQRSTSEQIGSCLSIARAMAKDLKLVCIDGVERLDEEHFAEFVKQATGDGFQYFVTRVGDPRKGEIAVREGMVAG